MAKEQYCIGCDSNRSLSGNNATYDIYCCHYILDTYKKRDCPSGEGCTHHTGRKEPQLE